MESKIKFYRYGNASKISIFYYQSYRNALSEFFEEVDDPKSADVIIFSHIQDVAQDIPAFQEVLGDSQAVLFSEEPLWDNSFSGSILWENNIPFVQNQDRTRRIDFHLVNHAVSNIFEFEFFPHFLTTDDCYIKNYADLLENIDQNEILDIFKRKKYSVSGLFSRRNFQEQNQFSFEEKKEGKCLNLLKYKLSDLFVENTLGLNCDFFGLNNSQIKGITDDTIYNGTTFHLKKLNWCLENSQFLFSMENTIQKNYITEKTFDALCSISIPIFFLPDNALDFRGINLSNLQAQNIEELYSMCLEEIYSTNIRECLFYNFDLAKSLFKDYQDKMRWEIKNRSQKTFNLISSIL